MKIILIIFLSIFTISNCLELVKDAKPAFKNPRVGKSVKKLFPNESLEEKKPLRQGKIVRGNAAELGQFPHQALLFMNEQENWYKCGGSFVRFNWVLSAGHCVYGYSLIQVFGGIINAKSGPAYFASQVTNPKHLIAHPNYKPDSLENDIGMIFMADSTPDVFQEFKSYLGVISFPSFDDASINLSKKDAIISGFGMISNTVDSSVLRWAETSIISNNVCGIFFWGLIKDSNICINTFNGRSTCYGDSGGPLTVEIRENESTLVGVTSFVSGMGCTSRLPAGFTRVTYYLNWINQQFNKPL